MTSTFELDLWVNISQRAKYIGQSSFSFESYCSSPILSNSESDALQQVGLCACSFFYQLDLDYVEKNANSLSNVVSKKGKN